MIDRYELREELGRSPHSLTTLRVDRETGERCVVKSLDLADVGDLKIVEMFHREAKVLRGLDHPGIPRLLDSFEERGSSTLVLHLVQEHVEGVNLAVARERKGNFEEREVVRIARALLKVLHYLHSFSPPIIHRDIKPTNVILAKNRSVHLIDFSGVRDTMKQERHPEGGFTIIGSYGYMPFEQYEGRALPASDIYALGMTLIFLLTGLEPIDLDRDGMRVTIPEDVAISKRLRETLERMIDPDAEKRFQSAEEVAKALPPSARAQLQRPKASAWIGLAIALLGMVASIAIVQTQTDGLPESGSESASAVGNVPPSHAGRAEGGAATKESVRPKAWESFVPVAPDPDRSTLVAQGLLTYAGMPLEAKFAATPKFRIWSHQAKGEVVAPMRYSGSAIEVFDLEPGVYSVWADYVDGGQQFRGGSELRLEPGRVVQFEFHLAQYIQLRGLERAKRKAGACEPVTRAPLVLEWAPLEEGTVYDYTVYESRCDSKGRARPLRSGSMTEASLTLELPPNGSASRYQVAVSARRRGSIIGGGGALFVIGQSRAAPAGAE